MEMETKAEGFNQGLKRMLSGESFFITDFRNTNPSGVAHVAFGKRLSAPFPSPWSPVTSPAGGNYPCKVLPLRLDQHNGELVCTSFSALTQRNSALGR